MAMTGMKKPIGHVDFIANSGTHQPGCHSVSCSHHRAPQFFIESINQSNFFARRCTNLSSLHFDSCRGEIAMIGDQLNVLRNLRGVFHFTTNSQEPFARSIKEIF